MHEATRLQYLALLGIEQWLPRDAAVAESVPAAGDSGAAVAAPGADAPPPLPAPDAAPGLPAVHAAQLDALLAPAARRPAAAPAAPVTPPPAALPAGTPAMAGERVGCSLLPLGDGLLLVAAFVTPEAPGLSGPEYALLANIAAALLPGAVLPSGIDFTWPPAGVRLPGVDRPGAGREALAALLAAQRKQGVRDVVVLGEDLATLLRDGTARLGLAQADAPSLAAMLADPQAKRACWDAVRPLRRAPG